MAGGMFGLVVAFALAGEVRKPGYIKHLEDNGVDLGMLTEAVVRMADKSSDPTDPDLGSHTDCKGREATLAIVGGITEDPDTIKGIAHTLKPDLDTSSLDPIIDAAFVLHDSGITVPGSYAKARELVDPLDPSQPVKHQAGNLVVMHGTAGQDSLDTHAAWLRGMPSYGLNVGHWPRIGESVHRQASDILGPVDPEAFALGALVYACGTVNKLPWPKGQPVVHHFGLAQAA